MKRLMLSIAALMLALAVNPILGPVKGDTKKTTDSGSSETK